MIKWPFIDYLKVIKPHCFAKKCVCFYPQWGSILSLIVKKY